MQLRISQHSQGICNSHISDAMEYRITELHWMIGTPAVSYITPIGVLYNTIYTNLNIFIKWASRCTPYMHC